MKATSRTVLVFLSAGESFSMRKFAGIQRGADALGWDIQTVEYTAGHCGRCDFIRTPVNSDIKGLLAFWNPAGCIVDCGRNPEVVRVDVFGRCPAVFVDRNPQPVKGRVGFVCGNDRIIAEQAARELFRSGFDDFAYVPIPTGRQWSIERGLFFREFVKMNGKRFHGFEYLRQTEGGPVSWENFASWLRALPKPCGIFAANDTIAEGVVIACARCGISIPDDIAVVGVDDERCLCENARPTISSIGYDMEEVGLRAVHLLEEVIGSLRRKKFVCRYERFSLTRRASSRFLPASDRRVKIALEYIRKHAQDGIGPSDVVRMMGCSRRLADLRFGELVGHSLLDEIHANRLDLVKEGLCDPDADISLISSSCGYSSITDLRRVFKQRTGMTIREYRRAFSKRIA